MTAATVQPATAAREGEAAPMAWLPSAVGDRRQQEDEETGTGGESCDWAEVAWAVLFYLEEAYKAQPKSCAALWGPTRRAGSSSVWGDKASRARPLSPSAALPVLCAIRF
jgi:hypothetical protein